VLIFLLICFSWLGATRTLQRTAFWCCRHVGVSHTGACVAHLHSGSPAGDESLTRRRSSSAGVWAFMCLGLELIYRNGVGSLLSAVIGFLTLIIAHHLAVTTESGDTMQMMQAVLDTNIWLATHVVVITLGYAATFLAGFLAIAYVIVVYSPKVCAAREQDASIEWSTASSASRCCSVSSARCWGGIWADHPGADSGDGIRKKTARC